MSITSGQPFPTILDVKVFLVGGVGDGADYHSQKQGHWIIDDPIASPMSRYPAYKASRTQWGINVLGSLLIKITTTSGHHVGISTGLGGPPAAFIISQHLRRFLVGSDPRDVNRMWDQMYSSTLFYGRKGLAVAAISCVDLALWDLLGKIRGEPVYKLIGGCTKDPTEGLRLYCTGPRPEESKSLGFLGGKVPLPYGPSEVESIRKNYEFLKTHREAVGPDFPLMVDCYMALNVAYAIELARKCEGLGIEWWEEVLPPDDVTGYARLREALPWVKWTTGEHEYTRYGFKELLHTQSIAVLQPDVTWVGGLTELLKISALASAYDIPVIPHASSVYSYHFAVSQVNTPFAEIVCNAADGRSVKPTFGRLFLDEPLPVAGKLDIAKLDKPGFGLTLNPEVELIEYKGQ